MIFEFVKVFFTILADEIGDKSQLATLGFASTEGRWLTFFASATALVIASFIASFAGGFLQGKINPKVLAIASGTLFIIIGVWTIYGAFKTGR